MTGTAITVVSQPMETAQVTVTVAFSCPRGKWCTAGLVVHCPRGTYNPLDNQQYATSCVRCPSNSYTVHEGSASRADCVCDAGYYDANASHAIDWDLIDAMVRAGSTIEPVVMTADVVESLIGEQGRQDGKP